MLARRVSVRQVGLAGAGQFEIAIELTSASAATHAAAVAMAVAKVEALLGDLRAGRIDAEALAGARNRLRTRRLAELETPAGRAQRLARYQVLAGDAGYLRRDLERLAAVDAPALQAVVDRSAARRPARAGDRRDQDGASGRPAARPSPATAARPAPRPAPAPFRLTRDDPRWQKPPAIARAKSSTGSRAARLRPDAPAQRPAGVAGWRRRTPTPSAWIW